MSYITLAKAPPHIFHTHPVLDHQTPAILTPERKRLPVETLPIQSISDSP